MNNPTIDVVLTGEFSDSINFEQACAAIEKMFKLSNEQAQQLLNTAPRIIKRGLDAATAEKYQQTIEKAGLKVQLKNSEAAAQPLENTVVPPTAAPAVATTPVTVKATTPVVADTDMPMTSSSKILAVTTAPDKFDGLEFKVDGRPDFAFLTVKLPAGQMLKVEASAMATMDTNLVMKTKMKGGISRMLSGENLFLNEFTAEGGPGEIGIAPATPGDLIHRHLRGEVLYLQSGAFVASTPDITIETKWQGFTKGFFSGESLFLIRASGKGDLWLNSYGAIIEIDVKDGYVVDTGNIVAFTEGLEYSISKVGGYKSLFFSGEGFVCRFKGEGKLWIQTRSVGAFAGWARQYRPAKE